MNKLVANDDHVLCPQINNETSIIECERCPYFAVKLKDSSKTIINCKFES
ncbi:MAG: hypothetical protein ACFFDN_25660 [Candidatus Hodarchaeota archaeon]